ncbi:hypothetical protein DM02DRAFT_636054 [Periconia macrospinosa]|uniref:Zn(2)-C6 fungal-type domain-containing protein n=1 Tax=Periconia macrospinosa TaxID=97972 RepID=A0A2V1D0J3_9PLEO|nr:hypothetical protein DM02DRAFT_636054 [Periconia macrospinosa]
MSPYIDTSDRVSVQTSMLTKSIWIGDLLMRHRRRCQGPISAPTRRKACDACVQAKTKCCYSQPTCSRCAKRGQPCVYLTNPNASSADHASEPMEVNDEPRVDTPACEPQSLQLLWDSPLSSWPMEAFDMSLPTPTQPVSLPALTSTDLSNGSSTVTTSQPFLSPGVVAALHSRSESEMSFSTSSWNIPLSLSVTQSNSENPTQFPSPTSLPTTVDLVRLLGEYPSSLLRDEITSPFLHPNLYADDADMASLPLTSMAICCGSSVNAKETVRFVRRVMDAERQRLIEAFPSYECMQQWDALHAMLLYEVLELRESLADELEAWKHRSKVKGLRSPFLLKMTQCYARSYPQISNPDITVFSNPDSAPTSTISSPWARWKITETARRTVFLANIVNFYINHNNATGKQLPYYEPLDDDLILGMPLPCSHAAWIARDESEWVTAMQTPPPLPALHHVSKNSPEWDTIPDVTLKTILSKYTKDYIHSEFGRIAGFSDSDKLRAFIILCATEQFN